MFIKNILKNFLIIFTDESGIYWLKAVNIEFLLKNFFKREIFKFSKLELINNKKNIKEIFNFYQKNISHFNLNTISQSWKNNFETKFKELFAYLEKKNLKEADYILHNMQENKILHGLDFANYINSRNIREFILLTIYKLNKIFLYLNLKNSLQKEGLSNKLEYYDYQKNLNIIKSIYNFSSLKKKINKKPCIKINNFFINASDIDGLYSSLRIKEIIDKNIKKKNKINIVEIGAGLGKTAINLVGLMSKRIEKFFIVDLMPINIIQIYNFSNFFKKNQIWYPGSGRQIKNCKIIIVPNNMIEIINNYKFDILFNENSFPEMIPEEINKILNIFNKKGKFLFSINHETIPNKNKFVHSSLANLIKKNKINLIDRRLSWMKDGYYENLYTNQTVD